MRLLLASVVTFVSCSPAPRSTPEVMPEVAAQFGEIVNDWDEARMLALFSVERRTRGSSAATFDDRGPQPRGRPDLWLRFASQWRPDAVICDIIEPTRTGTRLTDDIEATALGPAGIAISAPTPPPSFSPGLSVPCRDARAFTRETVTPRPRLGATAAAVGAVVQQALYLGACGASWSRHEAVLSAESFE